MTAFGDFIDSIGDIITAVLALIDDPEAFLNEQYTLIRDTVNLAVQDTNNFVDEALAGLIRLDLLQENPTLWVGTIGCELLIEVLITLTGAGAAAVAAKLTEKVIDFLQARRRALDSDGEDGLNFDCNRSFSAETEVLLADGSLTAMAKIEVGDLVWASDPETGVSGGRAVTAVWPHTDTLLEYEVGDGTVTTTEDHEFWNATDQEWQETQQIDPGDFLLGANGELVEAGSLLWDTAHVAEAFDLTVAGIHTYFVSAGANQVLVHNCGSTDFPSNTKLTPDEIQTANRLIQLDEFEGIELRGFHDEFGNNKFDYVDQNGVLYDQIGGKIEISDDWLGVVTDGVTIRRDSFEASLRRHFDKSFEGLDGIIVVDVTGWSDLATADVLQMLEEIGLPDRTIVIS